MNKLYSASEYLTEDGYEIVFTEWSIVRETPCYYFWSISSFWI